MSTVLECRFDADPAAPARARGFVVDAIAQLTSDALPARIRADLELVVSELVTNAVRAQSRTVTVSVALDTEHGRDDRVVVSVEDEGQGWPQPRVAEVHDTTGRGLALVSALCVAWGVRLGGPGCKTVWAHLELPAGAAGNTADSQPDHR